MSKILALKEWVTVTDAAEILSRELNEVVKTQDIYQLALDNKITLSLHFVESIRVEGATIQTVSKEDFFKGDLVALKKRGILLSYKKQDKALIFNPNDCHTNIMTRGNLDIVNNWGGHLLIYNKFYETINEPMEDFVELTGIVLRSVNKPEKYIRILKPFDFDNDEELEKHPLSPAFDSSQNAHELPKGTLFIVRVPILMEFIKNLTQKEESSELHSKERASLYKLVTTLCDLSDLPIQNEYKTADILIEHATLKGIEVPSRGTLAKYLKAASGYLIEGV